MTTKSPRPVTARQWTGLLLVTTALGAGMAPPVLAQEPPLMVQAEGGEGGEAGAVAGVDPETAYLVRLAIVEGHLIAAAALYEAGMVDDAIGLSYHPEAEMMDEVRSTLTAHGQADFTPAMQVFSAAMESHAAVAEMQLGLTAVQAQIAAAVTADAPDAQARFAVAVAVLKAAAAEYAGSIEGAEVSDVLAYHEAEAFVAVARAMVAGVGGDAKLDRLATRAAEAMDPAAEAFGKEGDAFVARDPAILLGVAARVELIASQVR